MEYEFKSQRLGCRRWKADDAAIFADMNKDEDVMAFYPKRLTQAESDQFIAKINTMFQNYGYGLYAIDELATKTFIGYIGFWHITFESEFTPFTEIGWKLKKEKWNQGFATEGAKACLQFGFHKLKFTEVYSLTAKINLKSERIMQKIGMHKIAELEHPNIENDNPLKLHILYKIEKN